MKVIVAGGRDFIGTPKKEKWLIKTLNELNATELISGMARGADAFGIMVADFINIPVNEHPALWDDIEGKPRNEIGINKYGKLYWRKAGFFRNEEMAKVADACILFPGGNGTKDMKKRAIAHNLKIIEYKQ